MAKPRTLRRPRVPIDWRRRSQIQRLALPVIAVLVVILVVVAGRFTLSSRLSAAPPTPTALAQATPNPIAALVDSAIQNAEVVGEVKPALPSYILYATATVAPTSTPVPQPTATELP